MLLRHAASHNPRTLGAMYVKLFGSILDSSIWSTDLATRVVWITMLTMADEYGIVYASVDGLANRARVSIPECRRALRILVSGDRNSRTKNDRGTKFEGRRVETVEGGWQVINYRKYRELRSRKQIADAMRQARHRVKEATERDRHVTNVTSHDVTVEAEAEAEAEENKSKALLSAPPDDQFEVAWSQYPKRGGNNSRQEAARAWHARRAEGVLPETMLAGLLRYATYCDAEGWIGSRYVMQGKRFFGPSRPFAETWDQPLDPDAWKRDPSMFRPGESQEAYIRRRSEGNGR